MKKFVSAAVALAVAGMFGFGTFAPTPVAAQSQQKMMDKAPAKKAETSMKKSTKKSMKKGSKSVMALQKALNKNGAKLKVDGMWGRKTLAALKAYQSRNKLKASGRLDKATRAKLGL